MIDFWRTSLKENSKKQYDEILNAIKQKKSSVVLTKTQNIVDEIQKIYKSILLDHPEFYYVSPQFSISIYAFSLNVNLSYLYSDDEIQKIDKSFDKLQKQLSGEVNKSDIEKIYSAMFLIMKNSHYEINYMYNQNAASAIHYHSAQCSGFASAFKYVMDYMGIWCIIVSGSISCRGQNGPHDWNIIKINNDYCHVDITSLATITLTDIKQLYRFKLFESDVQKKKYGYMWDFSKTPICNDLKTNLFTIPDVFSDEINTSICEKTIQDSDNLPIFTRLFDVQIKIRECLETRTTCYEFKLNIPIFSNEKLVRMINNFLLEQEKEFSVVCKTEIRCVNEIFYLKIKYNN